MLVRCFAVVFLCGCVFGALLCALVCVLVVLDLVSGRLQVFGDCGVL